MRKHGISTSEFLNKEPIIPKRSADLPLTIGLFFLQAFVSLLAIGASALNGFISDSCTGRGCNSALITFSGYLMVIGAFVLLILAIGYAGWVREHAHRSWWVPLVGTGAVIALFFISWILLAVGSNHSLGDFFGPN